MLPATSSTHLPEDAYHRGTVQYQKTITLLNRITLTRLIILWTGSALWCILVYSPSLPVSPHTILLSASITLLATGALLWYTTHRITKRHQYRNFDYRIALFLMKELGHANPAVVLAHNPQYLTAFQTITTAVIKELTAAGKPLATAGKKLTTIGLQRYETHSPSHRVASLVLHDENSLSKEPELLALIKDQHITDYDQLATMMDTTSQPQQTPRT
jgi:hypothetical protein